MITNKAAMLTLCLMASSSTIAQDVKLTFAQRVVKKYEACKKKRDKLIKRILENKKLFAGLGIGVTALITVVGFIRNEAALDNILTWLQSFWDKNTGNDAPDSDNSGVDEPTNPVKDNDTDEKPDDGSEAGNKEITNLVDKNNGSETNLEDGPKEDKTPTQQEDNPQAPKRKDVVTTNPTEEDNGSEANLGVIEDGSEELLETEVGVPGQTPDGNNKTPVQQEDETLLKQFMDGTGVIVHAVRDTVAEVIDDTVEVASDVADYFKNDTSSSSDDKPTETDTTVTSSSYEFLPPL